MAFDPECLTGGSMEELLAMDDLMYQYRARLAGPLWRLYSLNRPPAAWGGVTPRCR